MPDPITRHARHAGLVLVGMLTLTACRRPPASAGASPGAGDAASDAPAAIGACGDAAARTDLDALWGAVRDRYVYLPDKALDWTAARALTRADGDTVHSPRALVGALERLLDNLYDPHATLRTNTARSPRLVPSGLEVWAEWDAPRGTSDPRRAAPGDARAVAPHDADDAPLVTAVRPGSGAERAGVRAGQRVLAINDVPVRTAAEGRLGPAIARPAPPAAWAWALLSALAGRHDSPRILRVRDADGSVRNLAIDPPVGDPDTDDAATVPHGPLEVRRLASGPSEAGAIGYVRVLDALGDDRTVAAFDSALSGLRGTRALVLDLRDTPSGGNTGVAEPMMGRLLTRAAGYQRVVPRSGPATMRHVVPRGPWAYTAPVVVLVGRWTGSMGEGMAIGLDGIRVGGRPRATVVGTRMAGLAGAVEDVRVPCSGIEAALPVARLLHVDGTPRERWVPPVLVDLVAAEASGRTSGSPPRMHDVVLDRALAVLSAR